METPWVNCPGFCSGLLALICAGCLPYWDRGVCVCTHACVCMLGGTPWLIHRNSTTVSVCLGCDNKSTINWLAWKQQKVLLTAAEAGSPGSRCWQIRGLLRPPPTTRWLCPSLVEQARPHPHDTITSQRPHLLIPSH